MHWSPSPIETVSESTTSTGQVPLSAFAATWAACIVADKREERLMHTIPSAPSSARRRNVSSKAPADGAAVSGSTSEVATLRQNSSLVSSTRSTYSFEPNRIVSGTISIPSSSARSTGRSHELSVTTRTPTGPPRIDDGGVGPSTV